LKKKTLENPAAPALTHHYPADQGGSQVDFIKGSNEMAENDDYKPFNLNLGSSLYYYGHKLLGDSSLLLSFPKKA